MGESGFIGTKDSRWTDLLRIFPYDVYQTPEYAEFSAKHEGGEPMAFYAEANGYRSLIPLLVRAVPQVETGWRDASSPYGYPGVIGTPEASPEDLRAALFQFQDACREANIVSAFIRLHPFQPLPAETLSEFGAVIDHGETVYVDLTKPEEEVWRGIRRDHRKGIKRLLALGFTASIDRWELLDEAASVYRSTMLRVGADPWYLFSNSYFQDLKATLGPAAHLCTVMSPEGTLAAAGVFTVINEIAEGHLSGSAEEYRALAPAKLKTDATLRWLMENGCRRLHLGGGVGCQRDSLFDFKSGFSKDRSRFQTFRMIIDAEKYKRLTEDQAAAGADSDMDYFPAYRSPKHFKKLSKIDGAALLINDVEMAALASE